MDLEFTDYAALSVIVVSSTDRALRINHDGDEQWVPRSLIKEGDEDFGDGECVDISIAEWKLKRLGWLE